MAERYHFAVTLQEQGAPLLGYLREKLTARGLSTKAIKRAIDGRCCRVNGRIERFATHLLGVGDRVELVLLPPRPLPSSLQKLYESEHLFICNKPAGIPSEPHCFPYPPLHRLDKETSGALILTKSEEMRKKMVTLFRRGGVQKGYLAIVDGRVKREAGSIDNFLGKKHLLPGQTVWGVVDESEGRRAVTHWRRLALSAHASLLHCVLVTGRTHQLRVHLSALGHPILGDAQYGKRFLSSERPERHLLHAHQLKFEDPLSLAPVALEAPLPGDFHSALVRLFPHHPLTQECLDDASF